MTLSSPHDTNLYEGRSLSGRGPPKPGCAAGLVSCTVGLRFGVACIFCLVKTLPFFGVSDLISRRAGAELLEANSPPAHQAEEETWHGAWVLRDPPKKDHPGIIILGRGRIRKGCFV